MRRQSLSALIAATAVIGFPTANAIAALTASPPSSSSTKGKAKAAAAKAAQAKAAAAPKPAATTTVGARPTVTTLTTLTTEAGVIKLGPPLDLMPSSTVAKPSAPATEWTYVGDTVELDLQNAKLDLIAGATRASVAYAASLQSAIDKAGIRP